LPRANSRLPHSQALTLNISTVRVHKEEIGETCMKMLLERLHHPLMAFSQRILPTELVIRGTVCHL
jgi:DNA-binding LacI/PurR family transcriptional regulator